MYNAQQTISRVQTEIRQKKETQKHVLEECGLSENTLKKMTDKQGMASFSLTKIADYLYRSVDYLLGRTDNPQAHKGAAEALLADEKRALELFSRLDDLDRGIIIGRIEAALEAEKYKQDESSDDAAM